MASNSSSALARFSASSRLSRRSPSTLCWVRERNFSKLNPCIFMKCSISLIILSISRSTNAAGNKTSMPSASVSTTLFATSLLFFFSSASFSLFKISSFNSASVANSETSAAKSSFSSGSSLRLISLSFILKTAGFPAKSSSLYSWGKETAISFSSPIFIPTICSSKPGIKEPEPTSKA